MILPCPKVGGWAAFRRHPSGHRPSKTNTVRLTLILICIGLGGCAGHRSFDSHLDSSIHIPERCAVIFFVDGLARERMNTLLGEGRLPNIAARFVKGGTEVERAVTCLPSITYPNTVSLLTGMFPGHHGVLGNRWFDRNTLTFRDYGSASTFRNANSDFSDPTLFEILDNRFTVNVHCHTRRGVSHTIDHTMKNGIDWGLGRFTAVDSRAGRVKEVIEAARKVRRWPTVQLYYFPGVDEIGHRHGADSEAYADALINVDRAMGAVIDSLEKLGVANRTYFVLVSDHGHVPIEDGKYVDMQRWLREYTGQSMFVRIGRNESYVARLATMEPCDFLVINSAYRRLVLHLRGAGGWGEKPQPEEAEDFLARFPSIQAHPSVSLIARRAGQDTVRISNAKGSALIQRCRTPQGKEYRLIPESGDPLKLQVTSQLAEFAQAMHHSREWLEATANTEYPDFVPQIVELFDSPRSGDFILFAADRWSLDTEDPGGHGSCVEEDMIIPMFFSGPDLPPGSRIACGRIVDVLPTVLDLLGESKRLEHRPPLDGISLATELRAACP